MLDFEILTNAIYHSYDKTPLEVILQYQKLQRHKPETMKLFQHDRMTNLRVFNSTDQRAVCKDSNAVFLDKYSLLDKIQLESAVEQRLLLYKN